MLAPTPAPAPTPTVTVPVPAAALEKPAYCVHAETDKLQEVKGTPAGPYFVHHPTTDSPTGPTVIFPPGGFGSRRSAQRVWNNYLSEGSGGGEFRLVVPYSPDEIGFMGEARIIQLGLRL